VAGSVPDVVPVPKFEIGAGIAVLVAPVGVFVAVAAVVLRLRTPRGLPDQKEAMKTATTPHDPPPSASSRTSQVAHLMRG
jgi:hypothetical protein